MTAAKPTVAGDFRMSGKEFDQIMAKALQVKPGDDKKAKISRKTKKVRKKK